MKNKILYWIFILIFSIGLTILIQILFRQYRLKNLLNLNHIGKFEFVFTALLLPVYLWVVYGFLNNRFKFTGNNIVYSLLVFGCIIISYNMDFSNWWDTEGKIISTNDPESRDLIEIGMLLQFVIGVVISVFGLIIFRYRSKETKIT